MSDKPPVAESALPLSDKRRIDRICDAFEAQWLSGNRPDIATFLAEADPGAPGRPALIRELIQVDLFYRRRQGPAPQAEMYIGRFPEIDAAWLIATIERRIDYGDGAIGPPTNFGESATTSPEVTQRNFGDYEILDEIARGGMGVVYRARQLSLNRIVALKMILLGPHASPTDIERFHAEAEVASRLDHPAIVPIFEVGQVGGRHFYSMGFVEGRSLAARLAQGPLPPREAAMLVHTLCDAVQYAHNCRVIHRDLKPANIMLDNLGRPRITDFGLAKCLTDDAGRTTTGQMLGTPSYMPPEQAAGKLELVGSASDIYALGAVLYALLTGRPPFQAASSVDTLRQVIDSDPLRPSELAPGTSRDLETIALKCLQKAPSQRYASARALGDDLQRFLDGRTIMARPVSAWERIGRWCRRNPMLAGLAAAVALLLVAIAAVSTESAVKFREQYIRADASEKAENTAKQQALVELWDSYLAAARAGRMSRQPGQRFASLRAIRAALKLDVPPGKSKDELRTEAIAAMLLPDLELAKEWPSLSQKTLGATVDAAFRRYARCDVDGRVSIRRVDDDVELLRLPGFGPAPEYWPLAFTSDGRHLMQAAQTTRRIWDLQAPSAPALVCGEAYDFSPDGKRLATIERGGLVCIYDLADGKQRTRYQLAKFVPDWLAWNPRRPALFLRASDHKSFRLLNLESGEFGPSVSLAFDIVALVWHPAGRTLAISDADPSQHCKIHVIDAETGAEKLPPLIAHRTPGVVMRFNCAGDRLLSTDWSGLWRLWDVHTGSVLLTLPGRGYELRFSNDDRMVGVDVTAGRTRFYRFESGREYAKFVHRRRAKAIGYVSPDFGFGQLDREGRFLALRVPEGIVIFDVVRGEEAGVFPLDGDFPFWADSSGAFFTQSAAGLLRWPLTLDAHTGKRVYGPSEQLAGPMGAFYGQGASAAAGVMVFSNLDAGAIQWSMAEKRQTPLQPQQGVRHTAVSPDGRWIATGSHIPLSGPAARIWDARTGRPVHDLPASRFCNVIFSPDGKWLLTTGGGARLWSVGDWSKGPKLPASTEHGTFSPAGELLALDDAPGVVRLFVPATGKEVAQLNAPEATRIVPCFFTRDLSRLVCWADEDESLLIFNLGLIRRQLADMGLDWEGPPSAAGNGPLPAPVSVQLITGK